MADTGKGKVPDTIKPSEWASIPEICRAFPISRQRIYELIHKNRIRYIRLFGKTLIYRADIAKQVEKRQQQSE